MFDSSKIKKDFPFFTNNPQTIYLDSAATSQKPLSVIESISTFYASQNAPVHRGMYALAEQATSLYEQARKTVAQFIGAHDNEIVFTMNATDSINMVAHAWAETAIKRGDEIVISALEHHANFLVWHEFCKRSGAVLKIIPIDSSGNLNLEKLEQYITQKTKLVAVLDVSHALGIHVDIKTIAARTRHVGARLLIDACQSVPHKLFHVAHNKPDFVVFSGHKMFGPTGIGVLYVAQHMHDQLKPYRVGGGMVYSASLQNIQWRSMPQILEAGTPPIAQAIGLASAIEYLQNIESSSLHMHYERLMKMLIEGLQSINNIILLGPVEQLYRAHLLSFIHTKMHFHDVGVFLDSQNICVRTGNYCAQPLAQALGIEGAIRVSLHAYTTAHDIEQLLDALKRLPLL